MSQEVKNSDPSHFKGKDAIGHIAETQAKGIIASAEIHGTESPGQITSGADAARETALLLLLLWLFIRSLGFDFNTLFEITGIFVVAWILWKGGRSAWLGWAQLERMHRILQQEKWEIEHHRDQEKEELKELYEAKGFKGRLLDEVVDVLMSDDDRLLRVMVEEELRLSLEAHQHPLKQALGAVIGTILAVAAVAVGYVISPQYGVWAGCFLTVAVSAGVFARYERNNIIPAIIWNMGLAALASGTAYFLLEYFK